MNSFGMSLNLLDQLLVRFRLGHESAITTNDLDHVHPPFVVVWSHSHTLMLIKCWGKVGRLLRIYLTGNVTIETAHGVLADWKAAGRQGRLAFAMLAADPPHAVHRDTLASELWPTDPPPSSDRALTAIVSKVRTLCDAAGPDMPGVVSSFGSYRLRLPPQSWVDIVAAAESLDRAEGALRKDDLKAAWPLAQIACHIARRPFLAGDEGPWVQRIRRELRLVLLRSHECLAGIYVATGEYSTAVTHAGLAIELEAYRETAYLLLMRAHAAAGNRAEALRVYERCRCLLAEELGVSPSEQIEQEYDRILKRAP
jgi:DNA-binding SARP family transcriptional activator